MSSPASRFSLRVAAAGDAAGEWLIAPVFEDRLSDAAELFDAASGGEIAHAIGTGELTGKPWDVFFAPLLGTWKPRRLALVGVGPRDAWAPERARRMATVAAIAARERHAGRVSVTLVDENDAGAEVQAIVEGVILATFDTGAYQTQRQRAGEIEAVELLVPERASMAVLERSLRRGEVLGEACNVARGLANEPGNQLSPRVFAERAAEIGAGAGLAVRLLDEHEIEQLGMGLLLGVGRGSAEPPRLIVLTYEPDRLADEAVLGLVGKGVTFDTGGISIKPADGMEKMKDDMAGGAAVIAALAAIARLRPPLRVVGIVPAVENMPGGRAIRPGDVLRSASGKTVEVVNTDAEGRLVLGDALWFAAREGATHLADVATLTGSCVVALGRTTTGLYGTPESWVDLVRRTADGAGDRCWPLPLFDDYREQLKSDIADLSNSGGRPAGSITAAMFLKEFTGDLPWAHLDIAGTAWADEAKPWQPKGPTAVAVRTLAQLPFAMSEGGKRPKP